MAEDLTLLREVISWARAEGWRSRDRWPGDLVVTWSIGPDVELGVPGRYVGACAPDDADRCEPDQVWQIFTERRDTQVYVNTVREAVDVLAALGVLPARFSCAYTAGQIAACVHVLSAAAGDGHG